MQTICPHTEPDRAEQIRQMRLTLDSLTTEELLDIWRKNDRQKWSPETFEAVWLILHERMGGKLEKNSDPLKWLDPVEKNHAFTLAGFQGEFEISHLNGDDAQLVLKRLSEEISSHSSLKVKTTWKKIVFHERYWQSWRRAWYLLDFVDGGEIEVDPGKPGKLRYRFFLWRTRLGLGIFALALSITFAQKYWILLIILIFMLTVVILTNRAISRFRQIIMQTLKYR